MAAKESTPDVDVVVQTVGEDRWKALFVARHGRWNVRGEARLVLSDGREARLHEGGRLVLTQLTIDLRVPGGTKRWPLEGITPTLVRSIPVGRVLEAIRAELRAAPELNDIAVEWRLNVPSRRADQDSRVAAQLEGNVLNRGRRRLPDDHYEAVARLRIRLEGWPGSINQEMARRLGMSVENVRDRLRRCRELEYLAPGAPGQRHAEPGRRLLEQMTKENET